MARDSKWFAEKMEELKSDPNSKAQVYEVKIGRKWEKVRATSYGALSSWAKENEISDYRMVGMQSMTEMLANKNIKVVG